MSPVKAYDALSTYVTVRAEYAGADENPAQTFPLLSKEYPAKLCVLSAAGLTAGAVSYDELGGRWEESLKF
jgi:hypothetical protein